MVKKNYVQGLKREQYYIINKILNNRLCKKAENN